MKQRNNNKEMKMDKFKFKEYADKFEKFQVIEEMKKEFKETFPDTPESSPDKDEQTNYDEYENSSSDEDTSKKKIKKKVNDKKDDGVKQGLFSGVKSFFKMSKKEEKFAKILSTKSKKLPRNFANQVLDYELKIDSG
jgi:hypothetical protein